MKNSLILSLLLAVFFGIACSPSSNSSNPPSNIISVPAFEEAQKLIKIQNQKLHDVVKTKNIELLKEVYTADAKWLAPDLQIVTGRDSIIAKWQESLSVMEDMNSTTLYWGGEGKCIYEVGIVETKIHLQNPDTTFFYNAKYNNVWTFEEDGTYRLSVDIWNTVK